MKFTKWMERELLKLKSLSNINAKHKKLVHFKIGFLVIALWVNFLFAQSGTVVVDDAWIQQNLDQGALFFDQAGTTYRFETDFSAPGIAIFVMADNITIDLNGHTITFGTSNRDGTIGIYPFRDRSKSKLGSDDQNYSRTAQGGTGGRGTVVKNGRIIWGGTSGTWATCIGGMYAQSVLTIENMYLETGGKDAACVNTNWADITIHDTYCINHSTSTENRHAGPASIKTSGTVIAYNNIVVGGNSAIVPGGNSEIYNNVLRHSGFATNGYGVWLYRIDGVKAYNNIIAPSNGRGILYNAGTNHEAWDNLIVAHERPNSEYGTGLNPPALRIRYDAENIRFHDNKCLAIGGGENTSGSGAYLSTYGGLRNYIYDNEFRVILTGTPAIDHYANAITFESQGEPGNLARDIIENNFLGSNHYLIRVAGWDGGGFQEAVRNCTMAWIGGDETYDWFVNALNDSKYNFQYPAGNDYVTASALQQIKDEIKNEIHALISGQPNDRNRHTFYAGYDGYDTDVTIIDSHLMDQVTMEPSDVYMETTAGSSIQIKIGHSLYIVAKDANDNNIANKTITVNDNSGLTFTGKTDGSGMARLELIEYVLQKSGNEGSISKVVRSGHNASIAGLGTVALPIDVKDNEGNPYVLKFSGVAPPDDGPPAKPKNLRITSD